MRLCMISSDVLCARSMEVEWEDGTGARQHWSSWCASWESCWYGAEKLLPSSVTDIKVSFKVHGPGGPWPVMMVDRDKRCSWATCNGKYVEEVVWFRRGESENSEEVDVTFKLKGPISGCYLHRAWNSANVGMPKTWESWPNEKTRPAHRDGSVTLEAADGSAPLAVALGNPQLYFICTTKRVCAALRALLEVHRETLGALRELDHQFTKQWLGINLAKSTGASVGIASAVCLFAVPPVGIALSITGTIAGGLTLVGDRAANGIRRSDLRKQLSRDAWNAFVVAELLREWVQAQQAWGSSGKHASLKGSADDAVGGKRGQANNLTRINICRQAATHSTQIASVVESAVELGKTPTATAASAGVCTGLAVASQVAGVAGALISTGIAIRGWSTRNMGQKVVRVKIGELRSRILQIQHVLAAVDRLECPICADSITLADDVRLCKDGLHCLHANCAEQLTNCPVCHCQLADDVDLMEECCERNVALQVRRKPCHSQLRRSLSAPACSASRHTSSFKQSSSKFDDLGSTVLMGGKIEERVTEVDEAVESSAWQGGSLILEKSRSKQMDSSSVPLKCAARQSWCRRPRLSFRKANMQNCSGLNVQVASASRCQNHISKSSGMPARMRRGELASARTFEKLDSESESEYEELDVVEPLKSE